MISLNVNLLFQRLPNHTTTTEEHQIAAQLLFTVVVGGEVHCALWLMLWNHEEGKKKKEEMQPPFTGLSIVGNDFTLVISLAPACQEDKNDRGLPHLICPFCTTYHGSPPTVAGKLEYVYIRCKS